MIPDDIKLLLLIVMIYPELYDDLDLDLDLFFPSFFLPNPDENQKRLLTLDPAVSMSCCPIILLLH